MLPVMAKAPKTPPARDVFARNLRRARRLKDMSQEELAHQAGVGRAWLSGVEGGSRNITIDNMGLLAQALNVPLRDLVDPEQFKGLDEG